MVNFDLNDCVLSASELVWFVFEVQFQKFKLFLRTYSFLAQTRGSYFASRCLEFGCRTISLVRVLVCDDMFHVHVKAKHYP